MNLTFDIMPETSKVWKRKTTYHIYDDLLIWLGRYLRVFYLINIELTFLWEEDENITQYQWDQYFSMI